MLLVSREKETKARWAGFTMVEHEIHGKALSEGWGVACLPGVERGLSHSGSVILGVESGGLGACQLPVPSWTMGGLE